MDHLSGLDGAFLHLETPETPMHVGWLNLFQLPQATRATGTKTSAHIAERMHLAPVFTRKLANDALRPGQPGLDGRRRRRPGLPHPPHRVAQARHAGAARGAGRRGCIPA